MTTDNNNQTPNNDLRQEYRLNARETVYLEEPLDNGPATLLVSTSLDMSANGLRVIADCPLPEGCIMQACVQLKTGERFVLVCEVKWNQPYETDGEYLVGLSLFESEGTDIQKWKEMIAQRCNGTTASS
ncbi:PilZ domain-containing protein [Cellvibrio japonicus]|uniref:PilZ domain-containing protein n=1 Tax=Cellvibrio japonicus (strain Ueda107) TaxID=498211 RepID=B3PDD1_CELJU|nr:PilZ domain-containing protein [Cellvibrio japonicus]ACE85753.1 hypothetical protein CJA_3089 [Cellvibrio japonicus Ueda107]QEI13381.1 PilZ domain-containing protein [Cellvibrio japonicus]QEI16955.1 PilZ domain-containing protein [Cellvibrio japonicus]QEI20533.1 PilZ domain-containing protein [Cellvibrio japonicus]